MVENAIQIRKGVIVNVNVSAKEQRNLNYEKKIIFEILVHKLVSVIKIVGFMKI